MKENKVYRMTPAEYRNSLRNKERLVKLKEAIKPLNKILGQIRSDRMTPKKAKKR